MSRMRLIALLGLVCGLLLAAGCDDGDDGGEGTLAVEIWGEEFIEQGIPAEAFSDGWAVTYETFAVLIHDVTAGPEGGEQVTFTTGCTAYDVVKPGPTPVGSATVPADLYDDTRYAIRPATTCDGAGGTVDADVLETMTAEGYSVYVVGSATNGTETYTFTWGLAADVTYGHCHSGAEFDDGGEGSIQLTIHGDHLFYNSLINPEAELAFGTLAGADADGDFDITLAELEAFGGDDFAALDNYDVGAAAVGNLLEYLTAQAATLGHIDGEGHCE